MLVLVCYFEKLSWPLVVATSGAAVTGLLLKGLKVWVFGVGGLGFGIGDVGSKP